MVWSRGKAIFIILSIIVIVALIIGAFLALPRVEAVNFMCYHEPLEINNTFTLPVEVELTDELSSPANKVQIFDPYTNLWTVAKPIPTGVVSAGAVATSGLSAPKRIYVIGGSLYYSGGGVSSDMVNHRTDLNQVYDPETGEWSSAAPIPEIRWSLSLVNINDVLYAVGGINDTVREGVYYDQYRKSRLAPIHVQATEKYFPIRYEGLWELTPLASPTSPLSPSPSTSPTPTISPSDSPIQQPTLTQPIIHSNPHVPIEFAMMTVVLVAITIVGLAVYLTKFRKKKELS